MVDHGDAMQSEVFVANDHDHSMEKDRSVVFKKAYREAMDEILGRGVSVGAKKLRAELARKFGETQDDLPSRVQVY